jgi:hypothetical protein
LKKQLRTLRMGKDETIVAFFSKIAQTIDQLTTIGVVVDDDDLVQTAIDGLPESWGTFLASFNGIEAQPNFDRLWHDCLEEEERLKITNEHSILRDHALSAKAKRWKKFPQPKGKGKKPQGKLSHLNPHLSKVICFNCNKLGHYAKYCRTLPLNREEKVSSMPQLPLKKSSLKGTSKKNNQGSHQRARTTPRILSHLSSFLHYNQVRGGLVNGQWCLQTHDRLQTKSLQTIGIRNSM